MIISDFENFCQFALTNKLALAPIPAGQKQPTGTVGNIYDECSRDPVQWQKWVAENPSCNWVLPMGPNGLVAVDVDNKPEGSGVAAWWAWCAQHGTYEPAWITPSGGAHILFKLPSGIDPSRLRQPQLAPFVDTRAAFRSYVLCPPSRIGDGRYMLLLSAQIYEAPDALLRHVLRHHTERQLAVSKPGQYDRGDTAGLLTWLNDRGEFDHHDDWMRVGMALKLSHGEDGLELWRLTHDETVKRDVEAIKWKSFSIVPTPNAVTLLTFMQRAHAQGWTGQLRRPVEAMFGNSSGEGRRSLTSGGSNGAIVPQLAAPEYGESEIAERFVQEYGKQTRYVATRGQWLHWNGKRWCVDETGYVADLVRQHCKHEAALAAGTPNHARVARSLMSASTVSSILRLLQIDQRIATRASDWDQDEWLLGTPDGIVELRTGTLREARPEDKVTKSTSVTPAGDCPQWLKFMERATSGDKELQAYLQRVVGYILTGSTQEQVLIFNHGPAAAGKGTFMHAAAGILADYHRETQIETLSESRNDRHPTELANLQGARLVTCSETERGRHWNESRIKQITGGDMLSARFMNQNFFQFSPTFKIVISGNYKPHMRSDSAMRRRFQLVPFVNEIPKDERDPNLGSKLKAEWPGILAWAIAGCVAWQRDGLRPPQAVLAATDEYFREEAEDTLGMWLRERCDSSDPNAETQHGLLYASYKQFSENSGDKPMVSAQLGRELKALGFISDHSRIGSVVTGLKLRAPSPPPTPQRHPQPHVGAPL
jgi:P4 family phage/plasmid primase-like protien